MTADTLLQKPLPEPQDAIEKEFWSLCQHGALFFQRCITCGTWRHLPRYMCARCGSPEFGWEPSSGNGRLFSWTVTHQALHPAFAADVPYVAAIVELEEGVRMATRLIDCDFSSLRLDQPVSLRFETIAGQFQLPVFTPVAENE